MLTSIDHGNNEYSVINGDSSLDINHIPSTSDSLDNYNSICKSLTCCDLQEVYLDSLVTQLSDISRVATHDLRLKLLASQGVLLVVNPSKTKGFNQIERKGRMLFVNAVQDFIFCYNEKINALDEFLEFNECTPMISSCDIVFNCESISRYLSMCCQSRKELESDCHSLNNILSESVTLNNCYHKHLEYLAQSSYLAVVYHNNLSLFHAFFKFFIQLYPCSLQPSMPNTMHFTIIDVNSTSIDQL